MVEATHIGALAASEDGESKLLVRRLWTGTILMALTLPLYAVGDFQRDPDSFARLLPYKLLQLGVLLAMLLALRSRWGHRHAVALSRWMLMAFFAGMIGHAAVRQEVWTVGLSLLVIVHLESILAPVSLAAHVVVALSAAVTMLASTYVASGEILGAVNLSTMPLWAGGIASVMVGYELQRTREMVYRSRHTVEKLYQEERERAEESEALERAGRAMIATVDTAAVLSRMCEVAVEVLHCDFARAIFHRPDDDTFSLAASVGDPPAVMEEIRFLNLPRSAFAGLVIRLEAGETVQVGRSGAEGLLPQGFHERLGVSHSTFVPLFVRGRMVGILVAGFRTRVEPFSPRAERIAAGIGRTAALALENARLLAELDRANSTKDEFVATMSHELRSPLNILIGYSDMLLEGAFEPLRGEQGDVVRRMRQQSEQLLAMINDTLDLSRLQGGVRLNKENVDVATVLAGLERQMTGLRRPGVGLECRASPALPRLSTDRPKLEVILRNLVSNGLKFTERGTVSVTAEPAAGGIELTVSDTGIGIAPEEQNEIFEPFRQANSSVGARFGGSGLGLYIVRRMTDLLGGRITFESRPGHGSTFRVWLPNLEDHRARESPVSDVDGARERGTTSPVRLPRPPASQL